MGIGNALHHIGIGCFVGFGAYAGVRLAQWAYGAIRVEMEAPVQTVQLPPIPRGTEPQLTERRPYTLRSCPCPACQRDNSSPNALRAALSELESVERDAHAAAQRTRELLAKYDTTTFEAQPAAETPAPAGG